MGSRSDSLGRLTQVIEDPGTSPHLNYLTSYTFDALGNLTNVTQNGGRQRTFVYDAMSRLTGETNPETGTVTYLYDANGNLAARTAPAPNQTGSATVITCFGTLNGTSCDGSGHDLLHRPTKKSYSDGTTPAAYFSYDQSSVWGATISNPTGRLTNMSTASTGAIFSYDQMGRTTLYAQCTPFNCGTSSFNTSYTYDLAGNQLTATNGEGVTLTQSFDTAGRPSGLTSSLNDASHPGTLATVDSSLGYYPPGALRKMAFGNGLTQSNVYNNLVQPCLIDVNNNSTILQTCNDSTPAGNVLDFWMGYNAGSSNNGNVVNWNATGAQSFVRTLSYDSLNRIPQMQETTGSTEGCKPASSSSNPYNLTWGYDAWGNRTSQSPSSGTCSFSAIVNSQNQLSGSPYQYDAAGNMTTDGNHTYFYDAENRPIQVDGTLGTCSTATACYTYDALGHRVEKITGSNKIDYIYDLAGNAVSENCNPCGTFFGWGRGYAYFNGQQIAEYSNGTTYFHHKDHLGSSRLLTGVNQSVVQNLDFLPFGEQISSDSGYAVDRFTGDYRDAEANLDHTQFRQYSSQLGRWMHPDPAGLASVDLTDPQSWNRYTYAANSPCNFVDPSGLATCNLNILLNNPAGLNSAQLQQIKDQIQNIWGQTDDGHNNWLNVQFVSGPSWDAILTLSTSLPGGAAGLTLCVPGTSSCLQPAVDVNQAYGVPGIASSTNLAIGSAAAHELGHWLGLSNYPWGHKSMDSGNLMMSDLGIGGSYRPNDRRSSIKLDPDQIAKGLAKCKKLRSSPGATGAGAGANGAPDIPVGIVCGENGCVISLGGAGWFPLPFGPPNGPVL